ncbi:SNF1-related protein kinase regulatory subunit beta-2 isoform X2 [Jatropha curcas]|uniref:SNF1-related protein kinase regulatory subunit beta-2 isoform X2 n=1 Tax=Jatropha curcas TaxID=180498 RepID=UPI001892E30C|nr:SNF1-related protein kinase regulatory subunit beta-2 isoform X2 [Jatropha curcas]
MGNASGKIDEEDTSGEGSHVGYYAPGAYAEAEPMAHSPSNSPTRYQQPLLSLSPQVPAARPSEVMHFHNYDWVQNTIDYRDAFSEKLNPVMITWSYGGKQVAVTGSWDNWDKRQPLHRSDLPWECDDSGIAYNILDVQEDVPEAPESLSEFENSPSPVTSYNNESLDDNDFSKQPPDLPPQLQLTLLNDRSSALENQQSLPRPRHAVLNHLYIQNNRAQPVALGSTHRFLQKYVTVVIYKPSRR